MKFYYEWDEPELAEACFELERLQIIEQAWREERRRASLATVGLALVLAGLLAASFDFLSRRQVSGRWEVLAVALLGGLLGSLLLSLRLLVPLVRTRLAPPAFGGLPWVLLLHPFFSGVGAAVVISSLLRYTRRGEAYRPQTVYLLALAASLALTRLSPTRIVSSIGEPR
jgi:hypothetical protein